MHVTTSRATLAAALAVLLVGCASPATPAATGRVDARTHVVAAPALLAGVPDPEAGLTPTPNRPRATATPIAAVRVTDAVPLGTHVRAGDPVAHLDATTQDAALVAARADADLAARRVELLDATAADLRDKRADLLDQRSRVRDGIDTLTSKRAELRTARTGLVAKRAELDAQLPALEANRAAAAKALAALTAQRAQLDAAPPSPQRDAALAALEPPLTKARAGQKRLDAALAQARAGRVELATGLATLDAGLRTIEANLAKARDGLRKLDDGLADLAAAAAQLADATELARLAADATALAITHATEQQGLTTLAAPVDGVVVRTSSTGDVVAPGAPVVEIRPTGGATVTTWLPARDAAGACAGGAATVTTDWGGSHPATVATVGVRADYPPTAQATDEVHLARAVLVTLTLADPLPPGAPVDVTLSPCKEN